MALKNLYSYTNLFKELNDRDFLYQSLLDYGKTIPDNFDIRFKENYINGCQSQVWIIGHKIDNRWNFTLDSDSLMVKGIGKIVIDTFNDLATDEILLISFHQFKPLAVTLSTQRQRGLQAIINKIHTITRTGATQ
jgi:cysteine desulfuration protein SufE